MPRFIIGDSLAAQETHGVCKSICIQKIWNGAKPTEVNFYHILTIFGPYAIEFLHLASQLCDQTLSKSTFANYPARSRMLELG